jgi:hypothetical protein
MKSKYFWLLTVFIVLAACSPGSKKPDWVRGKSASYPEAHYLLGLGMSQDTGNPSDDQAQAEQNARANLARQVKTRIQSQLNARAEEELERLGPEEQRRFSQRVRSEVTSSVNIELEGVEIVENYFDEKTGNYYALAALDRAKSGALLAEKIDELEKQIGSYIELAGKKMDSRELLSGLGYVMKAEALLKKQTGLCAQAMVITGRDMEPGFSLAELVRREDELRNRMVIMVIALEKNPQAAESRVIEPYLVGALNSLGLAVKEAPEKARGLSGQELKAAIEAGSTVFGSEPSYVLLGVFQVKPAGTPRIGKNLYHFFKTGGEISLIDFANKKTVLNLVEPAPEVTKAGKPDPAQAASLSLELAGNFFSQLLLEQLNQKFFAPESK